jgi:hypothetical protein
MAGHICPKALVASAGAQAGDMARLVLICPHAGLTPPGCLRLPNLNSRCSIPLGASS